MLTVLLPAFNEEAALPKIFPAIAAALEDTPYRVLVIDDGSADHTALRAREAAAAFPVILVQHDGNKGLGQAMHTGFRWVVDHADSPADIVIALDADNTHPPSLMPAMAALITGDQADIVIASRYAPGGEEIGLSPFRRVMSQGASTLLNLNFNLPGARDYTCGYRAYRVATLADAFARYGANRFVTQRGFACMAEILIKLSFIGARIEEVGLVLRYDLKEGLSKLPVSKTIRQYMGLIRELKQVKKAMAGRD